MEKILSNKEKRFSHAAPLTTNTSSNNDLNSFGHIKSPNYGLLFNNNIHPSKAIKDANINKFVKDVNNYNMNNSHSLNHDFSQLYISNLKNQIVDNNHQKNNFSTQIASSSAKNDNHRRLISSTFDEINSYKKEMIELKKQMFQMEKSINFWNECTEYWRSKWRQTRNEKKELNEQLKQLNVRINKIEHQLKSSENKRLQMGNEINFLNEELSRYMYRYIDDDNNNDNGNADDKCRKPPTHVQYNSDRRIDYRKRNRRKTVGKNDLKSLSIDHQRTKNQRESSPITSDTDNGRNQSEFSKSLNLTNSKLIMRHQERFADGQILNKKRFSQVVMLDEDEIIQMNQEISPLPLSRINSEDCDTLKTSNSMQQDSNLMVNDNHTFKGRYMDFLPEEIDEKDDDDDQSSVDNNNRIKRGQFFSDNLQLETTDIGQRNSGDSVQNTNMPHGENESIQHKTETADDDEV